MVWIHTIMPPKPLPRDHKIIMMGRVEIDARIKLAGTWKHCRDGKEQRDNICLFDYAVNIERNETKGEQELSKYPPDFTSGRST